VTGSVCGLCGGGCDGADLGPLLMPDLAWLWDAVATASDRRGDADMLDGPAVTAVAPNDSAARAAVAGLVRGTPRPGQRVRVDLPALRHLVRARGARLTPGAVAAHATGRTLADRATQRRARSVRAEQVRAALMAACAREPELEGRANDLFEHLRRMGWVARLDGLSDATGLVAQAAAVAARVLRIPDGDRLDRRLLVPGDPHALDDGTPLAGVALAMLTDSGRVSSEQRAPSRSLWSQAGVDCDDLMGGLTVLGIHPAGWTVPPSATCTLPPRELSDVVWLPPPWPRAWVFVTENPSVLAAAADMAARVDGAAQNVRLVCTMGTPSAMEISAIAALATAGWRVAVRADFDPAGIRHVTALLQGVPNAVPWRMAATDYIASKPTVRARGALPPTPWDPELNQAMSRAGAVAFEESLLPGILDDLQNGRPERNASRSRIAQEAGSMDPERSGL